jgi:hypothetical protein
MVMANIFIAQSPASAPRIDLLLLPNSENGFPREPACPRIKIISPEPVHCKDKMPKI